MGREPTTSLSLALEVSPFAWMRVLTAALLLEVIATLNGGL
jgi:hypothetical protein